MVLAFLFMSLRLNKTLLNCESLSMNAPLTELSHKVVDLRKERGLLRGMEYLSGKCLWAEFCSIDISVLY